jgi:hypothetical protein
MKIKLFVGVHGGLFGRWVSFKEALEEKVNTWLAANPEIKIHNITQSSNGGSLDSTKVFLFVWYEDGSTQS